jgi:S1-C subfamily serine protease
MAEGPKPLGTGTPPPTDGSASRADASPPNPAGRLGRRLAPVGIGAAGTLALVFLVSLLTPTTPTLTQRQVDDAIASALSSQTPPPAFSQVVYQAVQPSLVLVQTEGVADPDARQDENEPTGLGSGVIVNLDGDILTSLHVVDGATAIELTFADGSTSPAEIVGTQPENDIAVVRATRPPLALIPATLGNPGAVRQGSEAYALGSPFGLYGSVSAGVISGLDRSFTIAETGRTLTGLFQIDAAVNPGNSGGALVDRDGRLIGIVTALINPTQDEVFIGIGLAVPIDVAGGAAGLPPY